MNAWMCLIVAAALAAFVLLGVTRSNRSAALLDAWAARAGHRVLRADRRLLFRGPYWFSTSKAQEVYRIEVRARDGAVRRGYACVGGFFLGLWSHHVDVWWDADLERRHPLPPGGGGRTVG